MAAVVHFPVPVGGTPLSADWVPSILFAVLYATILPLTVYRMVNRRSRTLLLLGTVTFSIERVVFFSLRALQARNESQRLSLGLTVYLQSSIGMGFIGIANDLVNLLRCLLVNPTFGSATYCQSPAAATKDCLLGPPPDGTPDAPHTRGKVRLGMNLLSLAFLAATVPGIIANANYSNVITRQGSADSTARLRYISTAIVPILGIVILFYASWGITRFPRIIKRGVNIIASIILLMTTVAIYRLAVMRYKVDSLTAPNPLNKGTAKAAFYIFHVLPEWIATLLLVGYNTRKTFGTGFIGDWRNKDETEKQRKKREARETKKALRKEEKFSGIASHDGFGSREYALEDLKKENQISNVDSVA